MASDAYRMMRAPIDGSEYGPELAGKKADLHLHSNVSHDVLNLPELSPRALYDKAVAGGMGFFTLTDHGTMRGVEKLRKELDVEYGGRPPIPVISGIEVKIRDHRLGHTIHVNVLGLDPRQMLELARRRKSIDRFLDFCRKEGLYHAYNHPFWFERGEKGTLETITSLIGQFPIIELNAGRIPQLNRRTLRLARSLGKQVVATSDSHTGRVGRAYSIAPGESAAEFLHNLCTGISRAVPNSISFREFTEEIRETIDLVFLRQTAFRPKTSFLRESPIARRIAHATLASNLIMRPRPWKRIVGKAMQVIAYPPAYAYILRQKQMHWRLGEAESPQLAAQ